MTGRWHNATPKVEHLLSTWDASKGSRKRSRKTLVNSAVRDLLAFLLDSYSGDLTVADIKVILSSSQITDATEDLPVGIMPVMVMRDVLNTHRVTFDLQAIDNWQHFSHRYGRFIIAA